MPDENLKKLGASGELFAKNHLEKLGWTILETNYRTEAGEIDIIATEPTTEGYTLVFVEVKLRRGTGFGSGVSAVDGRKQQLIITAAMHYIGTTYTGATEPRCRFDIAEVTLDRLGRRVIQLHTAAFTG